MILKSHTRMLLLAFGFLDALLLVRFFHQLAWPARVFDGMLPLWAALLEICRPVLLASFAFSSVGLWLGRRWAMVLSYVQFPFRLVFVLLTFGFISKLATLPGLAAGYSMFIILAMLLEVARLLATIMIHRGSTLLPPVPTSQENHVA